MARKTPTDKDAEKGREKDGGAAWQRLKSQTTPLDARFKNLHREGSENRPPKLVGQSAGESGEKPAGKSVGQPKTGCPAPAVDASRAPDKPKPPPRIGLDQKAKRRLSRGAIDIEARLDLHGMSVDQAHRSLIGFVSAAVAQEKKWLLVITGKGMRGEGKLRRALPDWLAAAPLAAQIAEYGPSAPNHGGDGAFYLRVRGRAKP